MNQAQLFQFGFAGPVSATNTLTALLNQPSAGGDTFIVCVAYKGNASIVSLTDNVLDDSGNPVNTYIPQTQTTLAIGGSDYQLATFKCESAESFQAGKTAITVLLSANSTTIVMGVYEATNVPPSSVIDISIPYQNTSGTSTPSQLVTIAQPGELLIACLISSSPTVYTQIGGWVLDEDSDSRGFLHLFAGATQGNYIAAPCQMSTNVPVAMCIISVIPSTFVAPKPVSAKPFVAGGIFEERPNNDTIQALTASGAWTNPAISGVALRIYHSQVEPQQGQYQWGYIDAAAQLAQTYGKAFSILVGGANIGTPQWVYNLGVQPFFITGQGNQPAPWDPIFQNLWNQFLKDLAARYDSVPNLAYVIFIGVGSNGGQCTFSQSKADNTELVANGGLGRWLAAYQQIAAMFANAFKLTPFISNRGAPLFPSEAQGWYQATYAAISAYGGNYGIKDNALKATYSTTQQMAILMQSITSTNPVGFQEDHPIKNSTDFYNELVIALQCGAQFVEIYQGSEKFDTGFLAGFNAQLLANAFARTAGIGSPNNQIIPPIGGTGTICRLIDIFRELYDQEKLLTLTDSNGFVWKIYDLMKGYVYPPSWYTQRIEFKPGLKSIFLILPNGNRQVPPLYTLNPPWHG